MSHLSPGHARSPDLVFCLGRFYSVSSFSIGFVTLSGLSHVSYSIPTSCENEYYVHHRPGFALHQGSGELDEEAVGCSLDTYYDVVISGRSANE